MVEPAKSCSYLYLMTLRDITPISAAERNPYPAAVQKGIRYLDTTGCCVGRHQDDAVWSDVGYSTEILPQNLCHFDVDNVAIDVEPGLRGHLYHLEVAAE